MLNLITDRTAEDVLEVATLKAMFKVKNSVGTDIEISNLGSGKHLVFEGTQAQLTKYMSGLKGAWNYTDLNRIGNAIRAIKSMFAAVNVSISVTAKNDWSMGDIPTSSQAKNIIDDLNEIERNSDVSSVLPESIDGMTYTKANTIEQFLVEAYTQILAINSNYEHCGNAICGSGGVLG